jgi:hypothetical protein
MRGTPNISDSLKTKKGVPHSERPKRSQRKLAELPKPVPGSMVQEVTPTRRVVRDFSRCPRCGAPTERCVTISEDYSQFWRECTQCNTYINTYIPQEHQILFIQTHISIKVILEDTVQVRQRLLEKSFINISLLHLTEQD